MRTIHCDILCRQPAEPEVPPPFPTNLPTDIGASAFDFLNVIECCKLARTCRRTNAFANEALTRTASREREIIPRQYHHMMGKLFRDLTGKFPHISDIVCETESGTHTMIPLYYYENEEKRRVGLNAVLSSAWAPHAKGLQIEMQKNTQKVHVLDTLLGTVDPHNKEPRPQSKLPMLSTLKIKSENYKTFLKEPSKKALEEWSYLSRLEICVDMCEYTAQRSANGQVDDRPQRFTHALQGLESLRELELVAWFRGKRFDNDEKQVVRFILNAAEHLPEWVEIFRVELGDREIDSDLSKARAVYEAADEIVKRRFPAVLPYPTLVQKRNTSPVLKFTFITDGSQPTFQLGESEKKWDPMYIPKNEDEATSCFGPEKVCISWEPEDAKVKFKTVRS